MSNDHKKKEGKEERLTAQEDWERTLKILELVARKRKNTDIAYQFGVLEKYVRDVTDRATQWPVALILTLQPEVQDELARRNPKLKSKIAKLKRASKATAVNMEDPVFVQNRKEHWDKLAELAGFILDSWANPENFQSNLDSEGVFVFSEEGQEKINWMLAQGLISHMNAEFKEFKLPYLNPRP